MWKCSLFIFTALTFTVHGSNILGVFPTPSKSHQMVYQAVWKELSERGHHVTVITPNPLKNSSLTNLTEIDVSFVYDIQHKTDKSRARKLSRRELTKACCLDSYPLYEAMLQHTDVKQIINSESNRFDAVIVELTQVISLAFAGKFKCPIIAITSMPEMVNVEISMGAPIHPLIYPYFFNENDDINSIWSRLKMLYVYLDTLWIWYHTIHPKFDYLAHKYFGNDLASLADIEQNTSITFVTRNWFTNKARPYPPNIIEVNRLHIQEQQILPKDLQELLDSAKNGVIYFSLGSSIKTSLLDTTICKKIIDAFYNMSHQVLWKFEDTPQFNVPKNVLIKPWWPQQAVLAHKNVKVFVTQGGAQSLDEAIFYKVPIVGMPFFGDQIFSINRLVKLGAAKKIQPNNFNSYDLLVAIEEVRKNSSYKQKISNISDAIDDVPMKSMDKVVLWTEYVIKHKGAHFLRNESLHIPLYQYLFLDIVALLVFVFGLLFYLSLQLLKSRT